MDNYCQFPNEEDEQEQAWREVNRITNNSITVVWIITTNTDYPSKEGKICY